jgi:DNA-binding YbaB/EbfC family protein
MHRIKIGLSQQNSKFESVTLIIKNMFGDLMGMMGKLKETQEKVKATKERLNTVLIDENSPDGSISVCVTANREIKSIEIADDLLKDKDQLEDFLIVTLNKAIKKATDVNEAELAAVAKEGMPNIPGMDSFLK